MTEMTVTMMVTFPEAGGVFPKRDKSSKLRFEADASQFAQAMHLMAFPDFSVIEATFVLKEVAGREVVPRRSKKEKS
jgi:hypothetical protein